MVVLDPGDPRPIPGVAVLSGRRSRRRADVLTGTLKAIFADAWGVRSDYYGRLAIRTLSEIPERHWPISAASFTSSRFAVVPSHACVIRSSRAWASYEALSAPVPKPSTSKPRWRECSTLLSRPASGRYGKSRSRLDIAQPVAERKWLLVSLAPGASERPAPTWSGPRSCTRSGARSSPASGSSQHRHPLFLYVDELATLTNGMPFGFE